jgi:hypothetical protein
MKSTAFWDVTPKPTFRRNIASIVMAERISELGITLDVTSN